MWTMRLGASVVLLTAVVSCGVVACGDNGDTPGSDSLRFPDATAQDGGGQFGGGPGGGGSGSGGSGSGGSGGGGSGSSDGFEWPVFGPGDPTTPQPDWTVYSALAHGDCAGVRNASGQIDGDNLGRDFFTAVVSVCEATVEHRADQWAIAELAFARAGDPPVSQTCVTPLLVDTVRRALAWHAEHPDDNPVIRFRVAADETPCGDEQDHGGTGDSATDQPDTGSPSTDESSTDTSESADPSGSIDPPESSG